MYLEDQAGTDLTVTVQGEEYQAEATDDLDGDGVDDTAVLSRDDGTATAFSDTDGDRRADLMTELDGTGEVTGQAVHDERSGDWIGVDPGAGPAGTDRTDGIAVTAEEGYDTDGDGVADSVVRPDAGGGSTIYTDVDGDGVADVSTAVTADGSVTIAEQHVDGEWTVVEQGRMTEDGYRVTGTRADDGSWDDAPAPVASVDPATGEWTTSP